jgi:hypothetical protein
MPRREVTAHAGGHFLTPFDTPKSMVTGALLRCPTTAIGEGA